MFFPTTAFQPDGVTPFENVDVLLEKNVSGTWKLVMHGLTDSSGLAVLLAGGDGDYRLRYTVAGVARSVSSAVDPCGCATYTLADSGRQVLISGASTSVGGYVIDLTFVNPPAPSGGGGTSTPPRKPRSSTSTFVLPTPSATPTPTPTPTSSPTPSSSPSSSPSATPSATPDPTPAGDAGFPWWIILIIVIAAGIVILIIVLVVRR